MKFPMNLLLNPFNRDECGEGTLVLRRSDRLLVQNVTRHAQASVTLNVSDSKKCFLELEAKSGVTEVRTRRNVYSCVDTAWLHEKHVSNKFTQVEISCTGRPSLY